MSKYIEYDVIDYRNDKLHNKSDEFLNGVVYMAQRIEEASSIDIVRCKECKLRNKYGCHNPKWGDGWANYPPPNPQDDDFCSYGVRKTNTIAEENPTPIRDYMVHGERIATDE